MSKRSVRMSSSAIDGIIYLILALYFIVSIATWNYEHANIWVLLTFFVNGAIIFYKIVKTEQAISLHRLFYIFNFIFLFFAPLQQYAEGALLWSESRQEFTDGDYIKANIIILIFMVCTEISYHFFRIKTKKSQKKSSLLSPETSNAFASFLMMLISIAVVIVLLFTGNVFERSGFGGDYGSLSKQLLNILRFFPVAAFMITWMQMKKRQEKHRLDLYVYALEILIIFFPFYGSISRFLLFGVYLTIISLLFSKTKGKSWYFLLLTVGFVVVFSSFNFFKYSNLSNIGDFVLSKTDFSNVDFDAYQMLMTTVHYTNEAGMCFGQNILTAIFSFVPRTIWGGKLLPTGQLVLEYFGATFTNVSCPWIAEWYFAFGWLGIPVGGLISGVLFKWVDRFNTEDVSFFKRAVFCVLTGLSIYILRGAMLPTFAFVFALILSTLFVCFLYKLMASPRRLD